MPKIKTYQTRLPEDVTGDEYVVITDLSEEKTYKVNFKNFLEDTSGLGQHIQQYDHDSFVTQADIDKAMSTHLSGYDHASFATITYVDNAVASVGSVTQHELDWNHDDFATKTYVVDRFNDHLNQYDHDSFADKDYVNETSLAIAIGQINAHNSEFDHASFATIVYVDGAITTHETTWNHDEFATITDLEALDTVEVHEATYNHATFVSQTQLSDAIDTHSIVEFDHASFITIDDVHVHDNKANLDEINQDLATTDDVTFNSVAVSKYIDSGTISDTAMTNWWGAGWEDYFTNASVFDWTTDPFAEKYTMFGFASTDGTQESYVLDNVYPEGARIDVRSKEPGQNSKWSIDARSDNALSHSAIYYQGTSGASFNLCPQIDDAHAIFQDVFYINTGSTITNKDFIDLRNNTVQIFSVDADGNVDLPSGGTYKVNGQSILHVKSTVTNVTAYTITGTDNYNRLAFYNSGTITVTLPEIATEDVGSGFQCIVRLDSTGTINFVTEGSDVIHSVDGLTSMNKQYGEVVVTRSSYSQVWELNGELA
jgi:hypothetical protein